jgi:hypothetical protein
VNCLIIFAQIFGGFISCTLEKSVTDKYRGSGATFLFSLKPVAKKYPWTGANQFFLLVSILYYVAFNVLTGID